MSTILVTGGAGFIGSHIVQDLLSANYNVIVIDNCINAVLEAGQSLPESLKRVQKLAGRQLDAFYALDLASDYQALDAVFERHSICAVIHLAALKAVGESVAKPLKYYENNVLSAINLLKVMKERKVSKLIFSSSATVYGPPKYLPIDESHPTGDGLTNPYGKSKHFIEQILADEVASGSGLGVISLRYFNPIGAHESGEIGEDPKDIPNNLMPFIAQVAVGRRSHLNVFGSDFKTVDGTGVRDYIHISDLASGHLAALERLLALDNNNVNKSGAFEVFNLGSGKGYSVLQMIDAWQTATGTPIKYVIAERRPGDVDAVYADVAKAARDLGWTAKYGVTEACASAWNWQRKNPYGYQSSVDPAVADGNAINSSSKP